MPQKIQIDPIMASNQIFGIPAKFKFGLFSTQIFPNLPQYIFQSSLSKKIVIEVVHIYMATTTSWKDLGSVGFCINKIFLESLRNTISQVFWKMAQPPIYLPTLVMCVCAVWGEIICRDDDWWRFQFSHHLCLKCRNSW